MIKHNIFVFARLKPSQINYKIVPLSHSHLVTRVFVLSRTKLIINNEKIECIPLPKILCLRPLYWIFTSLYGAWLINKKGADLIVSYNIFPHGFNGYIASKLTRKPFIFAEINEETIRYHKNYFTRILICNILNKARVILVPGTKTQKYWESVGFSKTVKLHSTINPDFYIPKNNINKTFDFIYVGEFDQNKRPDLILNSFIEIIKSGKKATLCLVGFGFLQDKLMNMIKSNGLDDIVTIVKTDSVLNYLQQSKIFVMASLSEGIPCSLFEAMSCELIPIVPNVGDISDVIKLNQNGVIYDGSFAELCKWMSEILISYPNLTTMRMNARKTLISEHSYDVATRKWNSLLETIV